LEPNQEKEEEKQPLPASPEGQSAEVRKELDQQGVTHQGKKAEASQDKDNPQGHMGAKEENVTPLHPPTTGASEVTEPDEEEENINPQTELTPG